MLALGRYVGESIIIGGSVKIQVAAVRHISGGRTIVSLGIEAPDGVTVDREEIHLDKQAHGNQPRRISPRRPHRNSPRT